jgi:AcrR family transcriptional regulator
MRGFFATGGREERTVALAGRQTKQDRGAARRQQVLDAALDCFRRHGFHGASMAEISQTAGMSVGHIYHYFENKDAIIGAIVDQDVRQLAADFEEIGKSKDIVGAMIDHAGDVFRRQMEGSLGSLSTEIAAEAARNPNVRAILQDADNRIQDIVRQTIIKSGAAPRSRAMLDARIDVLGAMFAGLPVLAIRRPAFDRDAMLKELRQVMRFLLQPDA